MGADGYDDASYAKLKEISPIYAVHKGMAPYLEIHGTRDDQVPYEQSTMMCDAIHKVGVPAKSLRWKAAGMAWADGKTPTSSITSRR